MRQATMIWIALMASAPVLAKPPADPRYAPEKAADAEDKMICKRFAETGSLVNVRRVCATKKQWEISRSDLRQTTNLNSCALTAEAGHC